MNDLSFKFLRTQKIENRVNLPKLNYLQVKQFEIITLLP